MSRSPSRNQPVAAERDRRLERVPALVRATPTPLLVGEACKRVEDAVEVRRDVEAEDLEVVADVPDHRELGRVDHVDEPAKEARTADSAAEDGDLHRARAASVRGPTRSSSRSRSAIESTSSARFGIAAGTTSAPIVWACVRKRAALPGP